MSDSTRPGPGELLTIAAAAKALGLTERSLWRSIEKRRIASVLQDGRRLVDPGTYRRGTDGTDTPDTRKCQSTCQSDVAYKQTMRTVAAKLRELAEILESES
jgi:hypothetical protein